MVGQDKIVAATGASADASRHDVRPEPLTPADCDLRAFRYMPLDVVRLRDSEAVVLLTGDEFRAAMLLWCAAWHQVPAASLPMNDRLLANLAGYGRDLESWRAVKSNALRGFEECADGRLYHRVIAEKALEAWEKKWDRPDRAAERSEHGRKAAEARWSRERDNADALAQLDDRAMPVHVPEQCSRDALKGTKAKGRELNRDNSSRVVAAAVDVALIAGSLFKQFSDAYPGECGRAAKRKFKAMLAAGENAAPIIAEASRANPDMPAEQWLTEQAWKQLPLLPADVTAPAPKQAPAVTISEDAKALADELLVIAGQDLQFIEPGWCGAAYRCQQWLTEGWPRDLIVAGVTAQVAAKAPEKISNVKYFDKGLARFIAQHRKPVPEIVDLPADRMEVSRAKVAHDPRSAVHAIDRVYDRIEQIEHGGRQEMPEAVVQQLPPRSVQRS